MAAMTPNAAADEATRVVADARELDDSLATVAVAMKDCRDARVALYRSESRLASALKSLKNERTRINELAASLDGINNDDRELIAAASDRAKATHTEATAMLPTFGSYASPAFAAVVGRGGQSVAIAPIPVLILSCPASTTHTLSLLVLPHILPPLFS